MSTTGPRPVLALDVDGVFVLDDPAAVPARRMAVSAWRRWRREVTVPEAAPEILARLAEDFDIVWASSWGHNAHTALREALGLPAAPWPFLAVQFHKARAVARYADGRPWALVEEAIGGGAGPTAALGGVIWRVPPDRGITAIAPGEVLGRAWAPSGAGA